MAAVALWALAGAGGSLAEMSPAGTGLTLESPDPGRSAGVAAADAGRAGATGWGRLEGQPPTLTRASIVPAATTLAGRPRPIAGEAVLVEDWSEQPLGRVGVPIGWEGRSWGRASYDFKVVETGDAGARRKVLRLRSEDDNSTIHKRVGRIDVREFPILEWQWRAVTLPGGADSRQAATDDQACQIYVVFPRFPTAVRSRIIGYVWDSTAPAGSIVRSPRTGMVTYVIVRSGSAQLGQWITEHRNVREDFRRIHGVEPSEAVEVVSIGIDSNDTRSRAESYMGEIAFHRSSP